MNTRPIEQARDDDLRLSVPALLRAALRAREIARSTGTFLVISRNGVIEHLSPEVFDAVQTVPSLQQTDALHTHKY